MSRFRFSLIQAVTGLLLATLSILADGEEVAKSLGLGDDGWTSLPTRLEFPETYSGTRQNDYDWDFIPADFGRGRTRTWVEARKDGSTSPGGYVALGWAFPAEPFWGWRVRLQAVVSVKGVSGTAFAALFVRVANQRARKTLVFDNMHLRPIQGVREVYGRVYEVVVNVPHPFGGEACPADEFIPDQIHAGFVLFGGRGRVEVVDAKFGSVHSGVPVTGGDRPWLGPPDMS